MRENPNILEEELFEAKQALFMARSVKELKFLQSKIDYLTRRLREVNSARRLQ
jgi:hypothetical protein